MHPYIHTSIQTDIHTYIHMYIYIYIHTYTYTYTYTYKHTYTFSQTVCPHSGVLTVRVEGRGFLGHIFSCEFSHKSSPLRCAFPLRRLAQARERGQGSFALRHFHSVNSRINVPFWDVHVHFDCAGSHRLGGASALWLSMCISGAWVYSCLYESSSASQSCSIPSSTSRSCYDDLVTSGSWHEDLGQGLLQFPERREDLVEIMVKSCQGSLHDPVQVLLGRACGDPCATLSEAFAWFCAGQRSVVKSLTCPCMVSYRFLWQALVGIVLESSSRGPCIKLLKMLCVGACLTVLLGCS